MNHDIKKSAMAAIFLLSSLHTSVVNAQDTTVISPSVNNLNLKQLDLSSTAPTVPDKYPLFSNELSEKISNILQNKASDQPIAVRLTVKPNLSNEFIESLKKDPKIDVGSQVEKSLFLITDAKTLDQLSGNPAIEFAESQTILKAQQNLATTHTALSLLNKLFAKSSSTKNLIISPWGLTEATTAIILANSNANNIVLPDWFNKGLNKQDWLSSYTNTKLSTNIKRYNYLFVDKSLNISTPFKNDYNQTMAGKVNSVDFVKNQAQEINTINQQIAKDSNGLIKQLLPSNLPPLNLILTNVLHFKSDWQSKFDAKLSYRSNFMSGDKKLSKVTYMKKSQSSKFAQIDNWTLLSLPFKDGQELDLILPPAKTPLAAPSLEQLRKLNDSLNIDDVEIHLPKLNLKGEVTSLEQEVMPEIAKWSMNALIEGQTIKVDKALHQAVVTWDEQGAEAASATSFIAKKSLSLSENIKVKFDRPFIFMIRQADTILFVGQVRSL